ncbi:MAG: ABC transporter ATP-binding protein [Chitinophagaceae bacterium]
MSIAFPLLQINELSIDFNAEGNITSGLQKVSILVNKGETVAIVGESGSGKSITSLSVLRLLPIPPAIITEGEILFSEDGITQTNLLKLPDHEMKKIIGNKISMIFQEPMTSLNPVFTCGDQVREAILLHQHIGKTEARQSTIELFEKVQLPNPDLMFSRFPHQLSGGQKQRVMIAMAMSCNPALLIADEPTTALDVTVQKTILQLISQLQQQNSMGVIFISHDLGIVAEIADRIIVMYKGKIVEEGVTGDLLKHPKHPYTKSLLACRPQLHKKGERLPVVSDFLTVNADGSLSPKNGHLKPVKINNPETKAQKELISVNHLRVTYPLRKNLFGKTLENLHAVDNVSFQVYEGETLGLVGESGCGKSTMGRAILRLIKPTSGSVYFKGRDVAAYSENELRKLRKEMQIVFQDPYSSLNPRLTVGKAILEPLEVHHMLKNTDERKSRVMELLKTVDLKESHYTRYPHEFSGGQRQRIVIARALAVNPSFVICDESVSSLDVSVQAQVLNLLNQLKQDLGFTVVFISHDLSVVRYISDRIMVMQEGKIVESGLAEDIYLSPQTEYTKRLISSIPKIKVY